MAKKRIYVSSIGRGQLGKLIRTDKEGNVHEAAKEVAKLIDYFMHQAEEGEFEDTGHEDVLSKALGEKRHGGRVTVVGVGVTNRDYLGLMATRKEFMDQVTKLCSRVKFLEHEMKNLKRRPKGKNSRSVKEEEEKEEEEVVEEDEDEEDENVEGFELDHIRYKLDISIIPEGLTPCQLALSNPRYRLVATGIVPNFKTGTVMHPQLIPSVFVRVGINYSTEMDTPLPMPLEGEAETILEAIGTLVFWPIELIVLHKAAEISSKDNDKQGGSIKTPTSSTGESHKAYQSCEAIVNVDTLPECLFMFHNCVFKMDRNEQIKIPIDIGITTQSKYVFLGREEIFRFLAQEQIEVCHILTYISKLFIDCFVTGGSGLFGFLCPSGISVVTQFKKGEMKKAKECKKKRTQYIVDIFKETAAKYSLLHIMLGFIGYYLSLILTIT